MKKRMKSVRMWAVVDGRNRLEVEVCSTVDDVSAGRAYAFTSRESATRRCLMKDRVARISIREVDR